MLEVSQPSMLFSFSRTSHSTVKANVKHAMQGIQAADRGPVGLGWGGWVCFGLDFMDSLSPGHTCGGGRPCPCTRNHIPESRSHASGQRHREQPHFLVDVRIDHGLIARNILNRFSARQTPQRGSAEMGCRHLKKFGTSVTAMISKIKMKTGSLSNDLLKFHNFW